MVRTQQRLVHPWARPLPIAPRTFAPQARVWQAAAQHAASPVDQLAARRAALAAVDGQPLIKVTRAPRGLAMHCHKGHYPSPPKPPAPFCAHGADRRVWRTSCSRNPCQPAQRCPPSAQRLTA